MAICAATVVSPTLGWLKPLWGHSLQGRICKMTEPQSFQIQSIHLHFIFPHCTSQSSSLLSPLSSLSMSSSGFSASAFVALDALETQKTGMVPLPLWDLPGIPPWPYTRCNPPSFSFPNSPPARTCAQMHTWETWRHGSVYPGIPLNSWCLWMLFNNPPNMIIYTVLAHPHARPDSALETSKKTPNCCIRQYWNFTKLLPLAQLLD